ncbi:hypothetical protein HHI36_020742 [Cryptolaemus montrouzieri]|uniref:Uncharacterized protein n=1 Tax=Cryptolaemus montrouzieri TaxID=559131 RepID=A0ABD2NCS4_9CUCU
MELLKIETEQPEDVEVTNKTFVSQINGQINGTDVIEFINIKTEQPEECIKFEENETFMNQLKDEGKLWDQETIQSGSTTVKIETVSSETLEELSKEENKCFVDEFNYFKREDISENKLDGSVNLEKADCTNGKLHNDFLHRKGISDHMKRKNHNVHLGVNKHKYGFNERLSTLNKHSL